MQTKTALIHKGLAIYIVLGTFLQMFLAGVWHSGAVGSPNAHIFFGLSLLLASLLALLAAVVGKLPTATIGRTALLFFLMLLQPFLIEARSGSLPFVSAFHALNAAFIGTLSGILVAMANGKQVAAEQTNAFPAHGD